MEKEWDKQGLKSRYIDGKLMKENNKISRKINKFSD